MTRISSVSKVSLPTQARKLSPKRPAASTEKVERGYGTASSRDDLLKGFKSLGIDYRDISAGAEVPLRQRVKKREQSDLCRRQTNLEKILKLALDYAPNKLNNENIDLDWLQSFSNQAENISNPAMQKLWAKILASEGAKPGSFSLRSLAILRLLTSREADVLRRAQSLTGYDSQQRSYKIITGYYRRPSLFTWLTLDKPVAFNIAKAGMSYPDLLTLSDLGILYPSAIESGELPRGQEVTINYGGERMQLISQRNGLVLTYYKYTAQGEELLRLIPPSSQQRYLQLIEEGLARDFSLQKQS